MADFKLNQTQSPSQVQRTVLLGRLKIAQAIQMPENEWARQLAEIERDPLIAEMMNARVGADRVLRYKRRQRGGISTSFYEVNEGQLIGSGSDNYIEQIIAQKKDLLKVIERIGQEKFEKYFLFREDSESVETLAEMCGLSVEETKKVQDFILEISVHTEFLNPSKLTNENYVKPTLIGRIIQNEDRSYSVAFNSPHLARGTYEINYDALKSWQKEKGLDRESSGRVKKFVGILELSNLKQGAFFKVLDCLLELQRDYFETEDVARMKAVSLRQVAKRLKFAPSTISRVMGNKSIELPWGREVNILYLMPGQRKVVLHVLEKILLNTKNHPTDSYLAKLIEREYGIKVSRRTVTACRHVLLQKEEQQKAA